MQRLLKSAYCFFAALLLTTAAAAQHKISGRVIDTTQEPLVGATITLKEKPSVGTTTDTEGRYTLTLPDQKEYTVQVSFVGYVTATKKTTAARQGRLDFILKEDQMNLSTVVITGTRTPKLLKDAPIITRVITAIACNCTCTSSTSMFVAQSYAPTAVDFLESSAVLETTFNPYILLEV